jgi:hypothetical protein
MKLSPATMTTNPPRALAMSKLWMRLRQLFTRSAYRNQFDDCKHCGERSHHDNLIHRPPYGWFCDLDCYENYWYDIH